MSLEEETCLTQERLEAAKFGRLASRMNRLDRINFMTQCTTKPKKLREEFNRRHPDFIFHDEDGSRHQMTTVVGPDHIFVLKIDNRLPNACSPPDVFRNIRFVPEKLIFRYKTMPEDIKIWKEHRKTFICPDTLTKSELRFLRRQLQRVNAQELNNLMPAFTLDKAVQKLIRDQKMLCPVSGLHLFLMTMSPFTLSVDRINSALGYTYENIQFVCRFRQSLEEREKEIAASIEKAETSSRARGVKRSRSA